MRHDVIANEIQHGMFLASQDTEVMWGWGTPAGKKRAQRRACLITKAAGLKQGKKVLEVGCGTGLFTEMFAMSGAHITAVDLSPELIAKARKRGLPADRIQFMEKPFEACEASGPFDAVIGSSVLHHLNLDQSLPQMFSLLKAGGVLCFAEPNMLNPQVWAERRFRRFFSYVSPDETAFVRWEFRRRLKVLKSESSASKTAGFADISIFPFDWLHPSVSTRFIGLVESLGNMFEKLPLIREFAGSLLITARKPDS